MAASIEPSISLLLLLLLRKFTRTPLELNEDDDDDEFEDEEDKHLAGECLLMAPENDLLLPFSSAPFLSMFLIISAIFLPIFMYLLASAFDKLEAEES